VKRVLLVLVAPTLLVTWLWWNVDVAATSPHPAWVEAFLHETMEHGVRRSSAAIEAPALEDAGLIADGASHYFSMCEGCHAGPGVEPGELAQGLYPPPPALHEEEEWSEAEFFWITKHGIKASGMPAFGPTHDDEALWSVVAFARMLPGMTDEAYEGFRPAALGAGHDHASHTGSGASAEEPSSAPGAPAAKDDHNHEHSGHAH
jgi:mono/diheme cytochrome c family protein